jgi:ABC-type multidrug transport system ATPase subunit
MATAADNESSVVPRRIERVVIRRVVKTYGATAALRGVDAELAAGRLTIIEGPNGSGKSTLLKVLGTVVRPTSGSVSYEPLGTDHHLVRSQIGWLSHEPLAYADLSGRENVELAARFHGLDAADTWERVSGRFELGRFAERPLRTNSRGQRQRIALARALVHQPSLVLLDEPTTGLDKGSVERLMRVVREEVESGAAVAVVSHEPAIFAEFDAAKIALHRGKVVDAV